MSLLFTTGSSQRLGASNPIITTYPIVVGMWCRLTAVGASTRCLWTIGLSSGTSKWALMMSTGEIIQAQSTNAGGTSQSPGHATAISAGVWNYVLARFISTTFRTVSILHGNGLIEHSTPNTSISAPAAPDYESLGASIISSAYGNPWHGNIAEYFLANVDIYDSAANIPDSMLLQLAYKGPWSLPVLQNGIVEYRSFKKSAGDYGDASDTSFLSGPAAAPQRIWTNINNIELNEHPPLAGIVEARPEIVRPRFF